VMHRGWAYFQARLAFTMAAFNVLGISFAIFHPWGCSTYASATTTSTPVR
jgi:hypothetical protein